MTDKTLDGGPVFPSAVNTENYDRAIFEGGMSMRDYFAAAALQALIAKSPFMAEPHTYEIYQKTAIGAYDYADAMLKARGEVA